MNIKSLAVGIASLLGAAIAAAPAGAAVPTSYGNVPGHYEWNGTGFQNSLTNGELIWEQGTISLPAEPKWTAPGQEVSGWFMGSRGSDNWNQVGWISYGGDGPYLFESTGVNGSYENKYFDTLAWGSTVNVALSCDLDTGVWQDWVADPSGGWKLEDTEWTLIPCDTAYLSAQFERYSGPTSSTFPVVEPASISNILGDLTGASYYPAAASTDPSWG